MIWAKEQVVGCRFENTPNNENGDVFTEVGSVAYRDGAYGREVDFSASGARIEMVDENYVGNKIHRAAAVTISLWAEVTTIAPDRQAIISIPNHFPSAGAGVIMEVRDNNALEIRSRSRGTLTTTNEALRIQNVFTVGEKYHCVGICDYWNSRLILYVNGQEIGMRTGLSWPTSEYSHTTGNTGDPCMIGAHWDGSRHFSGYIDELNIYRTALNDSDIQRLYHGMHPLNG